MITQATNINPTTMKNLKYLFLVIPFLIFLTSCENKKETVNCEVEKDAIETVLENYIVANENQNLELIEEIWAPNEDIVLYGTDSDERLMGWDVIREAVKEQFSFISDTYISASNQFIKVNCTGNTAWFAETLNYNYMYQGKNHTYEGLRFTGVVEKIDGKWKIVQAHLSVPASVNIGN